MLPVPAAGWVTGQAAPSWCAQGPASLFQVRCAAHVYAVEGGEVHAHLRRVDGAPGDTALVKEQRGAVYAPDMRYAGLRVLSVIPSLVSRSGGPVLNLIGLVPQLARLGVEVSIFTTDMGHPASSRPFRRATARDLPAGADVCDIHVFRTAPPYRFAYSPSLYAALASSVTEYDVVRVHGLYLHPNLAAARQAHRHQVPYVVSTHGILHPNIRRRGRLRKRLIDVTLQSAALRRAASLHVTTSEEGKHAAEVVPGVPRTVVPNGLDIDAFATLPDPNIFRERYIGGYTGPLAMCIGRVSHVKGIDTLIRAFALARERVPDYRLAIVGPDDEGLTPELTELAKHEGVREAVTFCGALYGPRRAEALSAADVWALPSRGESFGNAVVEALAAGRAAVISPAVPIAHEIAAAGAAVVAQARPQEFAQPLIELALDPGRRGRLQSAAKLFACRYDWQEIAPQMAQMLARAARAGA